MKLGADMGLDNLDKNYIPIRNQPICIIINMAWLWDKN